MSEAVKTLFFVLVAGALALGAYLSRPEPVGVTPEEELNKPLFGDFTDPLQAISLSIAAFNEEENSLETLTVANSKSGWVIQSKGGYPADAEEQMTKAANALIGLEVLGVVGDSVSEHQDYGVVEPTEEAVESVEDGLGLLVTIKGEANATLASLIIGKGDSDNPNIRYVRVPGRDRIYVVNLDPSVYSTDFETWIEKDLLRINPFDVTSIQFKDYLLEPQATPNGQLTYGYLPRMDATVSFDEQGNKWKLDSYQLVKDQALVESKLAENESLDDTKLNDVRNALDQLTIVNAVRKPKGLADNLKLTGNFAAGDLQALVGNGFFPVKLPGQTESTLNGNNGEMIVETKDSVRYRLLFGKEQATGDAEGTFNRFLFVKAELNTTLLQKPELKPVPEIKEGDDVDTEKLAQERDIIIQENKQKEDAYQEKRNAALTKIYELNSRFADWYYIISDEQFKKVFLKQDQLIKKPEAPKPAVSQPGGGLPPGLFQQGFPARPPAPAGGAVPKAPGTPMNPSAEEKPATEEKAAPEKQPMEEKKEEPAPEPKKEEAEVTEEAPAASEKEEKAEEAPADKEESEDTSSE